MLVKTAWARTSKSEVLIDVGSTAQLAAWTEEMEAMAKASVMMDALKYIYEDFGSK